MQIHLNGQIYEVRGGVNRQPIIEWPDNVRLDGQQLRKDRRYLSAWEIDNVSSGLGKKQETSGGTHLWDVENVDTRIAGQKILSPVYNTPTLNPLAEDLKFIMEYRNDLYFIGASGARLNYRGPPVFKFTAPLTIASFTFLCGTPVTANRYPNTLAALHTDGLDIWAISDGTGGMFSFFKIAGSLGRAAIAGSGDLYTGSFWQPQITDLGGTTHTMLYDPGAKRYVFLIGNKTSGQTAEVLDEVGDGFGGGVGTRVAPFVNTGDIVYAAIPQGIVEFDAVPQIVIDTSQSADLNPQQVMYRNYLHFKNKFSVVEYDGTNVINVGYDRKEGLPSDKMGEITAWTSNWQWIFAAVKGATYSHIISYDGAAWQYYTRWPTAGIWVQKMQLSSSPDSIQRLWCIPGNDFNVGYFLNPLVNPIQAGTYSYVPSGYYTPPIYGGGMPEIPGGWFRAIVTSDNINGTNDARIRYGLNGQVPSNILGLAGSIHSELIFGSPAGLEGFRIQPQIELFRNSADGGTTPVVREVIVQYLKDPTKRYISDFEVDIDKTARDWNNPLEAVIGSLNYISNLKTLMPFWYGQVATSYVKVLDQPANENLKDSLSNIYQAERTGFVRVRVAEIL